MSYEAAAAVREAQFGNALEARQRAPALTGLSTGAYLQYHVALALALIGDSAQAQALANDLDKRFPENTIVRFNYLPMIRAQIALSHHDAPEAIELLQPAIPYEFGAYAALDPPTCGAKPISLNIRGTKPLWSFRKSSTIAESWSTIPSGHSRICKSAEPMPFKAIPPRPSWHIRIS